HQVVQVDRWGHAFAGKSLASHCRHHVKLTAITVYLRSNVADKCNTYDMVQPTHAHEIHNTSSDCEPNHHTHNGGLGAKLGSQTTHGTFSGGPTQSICVLAPNTPRQIVVAWVSEPLQH
ncbi:MAG: hypothetical protein ACKPKO_42460, partial [Candidatus Fonsibacter sp.]